MYYTTSGRKVPMTSQNNQLSNTATPLNTSAEYTPLSTRKVTGTTVRHCFPSPRRCLDCDRNMTCLDRNRNMTILSVAVTSTST